MNTSNASTNDSVFPVMFVVVTTFISVLLWLCIMLGSLPQY